MADSGPQTKVARPTPPDALALPHVVEAIAMCLSHQDDFSRFLHEVPRSLWTSAVAAFLNCNTAMPSSVSANWPRIDLRDMDLPPSVLTLLAATLPLRPRIQLQCPIRQAAPLASLVAVVGPSLGRVTLHLSSNGVANGRGRVMSDLLLQCCPHLREVIISVVARQANQLVELNDALGVVAHPHVEELFLNLRHATATPRLGHLLAAWLSTAPGRYLRLANVAHMDERAAIAFCDALQANSSLRELIVSNVPSLGGFHGRTLPVSLHTLDWNSRVNEVVDDETLTDLATAVGRTQLKHLVCNVFGQLATYPAAAPMLAQLKWLIVSELHADDTEALIDGLSSVPALTSLGFLKCSLLLSTELLLETLATTCVHLAKLKVRDEHPTRDGATAVFAGVLRLPHLRSLSMSMRLSDVLYLLPELVAAGRQLNSLDLGTIVVDEETVPEHRSITGKRALYRALALIQNVPFVVHDLPEDIDAFVVEALGLGPRADRGHRCRLIF